MNGVDADAPPAVAEKMKDGMIGGIGGMTDMTTAETDTMTGTMTAETVGKFL